ncbi:MAG TPA: hypothetical protein VFK52_08640 [Nocardioidaceae bacterium]|nr:hypothetical protein [Nocardioidaceae bacterium]
MRSSKLAALVAIIAGGVWIASALLSWDDEGLSDLSTQLWWGGLGAFALASALVGYAAVTHSPIWLRLVVFFGAAALGGSILSALDLEMEAIQTVLVSLGGVLVVLGLGGLLRRSRRTEPVVDDSHSHRGGRRAAR